MSQGSGNVSNVVKIGGGDGLPEVEVTLPAGVEPIFLNFGTGSAVGAQARLGAWEMGGDGAQWKVPTGKMFIGVGFFFYANGAANQSLSFGHNPASFGNNTAPGVGDVYYAPSSSDSTLVVLNGLGSPLTQTYHPVPTKWKAELYPIISTFTGTSGSVKIMVVGYLKDAA